MLKDVEIKYPDGTVEKTQARINPSRNYNNNVAESKSGVRPKTSDHTPKIFFGTSVILILMLLVPPFSFKYGYGRESFAGYQFIFSPDEAVTVDVPLLLAQALFVILIAGFLIGAQIYSRKFKE